MGSLARARTPDRTRGDSPTPLNALGNGRAAPIDAPGRVPPLTVGLGSVSVRESRFLEESRL